MTRVKSGGDDDIAAFLQVCPQEDAAGVDVNGAGHLLLQGVHPVVPVQLHLGTEHRRTVSRTALRKWISYQIRGQPARIDSTVMGQLELGEPARRSQIKFEVPLKALLARKLILCCTPAWQWFTTTKHLIKLAYFSIQRRQANHCFHQGNPVYADPIHFWNLSPLLQELLNTPMGHTE